MRYGYDLHVFPGRVRVSDHGNFIYGRGTRPHDRMTAWFRMPHRPAHALAVAMIGLCCPRPPGGTIAGQVRVNGHVVFDKDVPFPEKKLGECRFVKLIGTYGWEEPEQRH